MDKKLLLTSFDIWLPHHQSNSSDDLLSELTQIDSLSHSIAFLRKLPVNVEEASDRVIATINEIQPDVIICCGMAEHRPKLTVESHATCGDIVIKTTVDLEKLITGLTETEISHNAGKFVCEGLYYSVLKYLHFNSLNSHCIFLHIPLLTPSNFAEIMADFQFIVQKMASLDNPVNSLI